MRAKNNHPNLDRPQFPTRINPPILLLKSPAAVGTKARRSARRGRRRKAYLISLAMSRFAFDSPSCAVRNFSAHVLGADVGLPCGHIFRQQTQARPEDYYPREGTVELGWLSD